VFDLTQQRDKALRCYEEIVTAPFDSDPTRMINPKLQSLARKFAKSPFCEKHARKLAVPFTFMSGIE
ncbi:MAG: hypothetical protein VXZ35_08430, partial [Pseudomonadota bacterium]|nr:hypothetical protein [Pseudomonadota bacterium]